MLYGNEGKPYSYLNIVMHPQHWTSALQKIKSIVENISDVNFTSVLLNYYRDGNDGNGWHADNEKELGTTPIIASLSLGAKRKIQLKHNTDSIQKKEYHSRKRQFTIDERHNTTLLEISNS